MSTPRLGVGVASLGGYLYAVGGSDGGSPLASMERSAHYPPWHNLMCSCLLWCRYDPHRDEWTLMAPMAEPRKHLGAAVMDGLLYAVGGRNQATELRSVERC